MVGHDMIPMVSLSLSLSLSTWWCRFELDSAFLSQVSYCKHGHPTFHSHKTRAASSDPFFYELKVHHMLKCIERCQYNMGTVLCHNRMSMNGFRRSKMVAEVLSVRKEPATEENGACMACLSAQNFLFQRQKEDYAMMYQVHKKAMGLY